MITSPVPVCFICLVIQPLHSEKKNKTVYFELYQVSLQNETAPVVLQLSTLHLTFQYNIIVRRSNSYCVGPLSFKASSPSVREGKEEGVTESFVSGP